LMRIKLKNMVERAKKVLSSSDKFLIYLENFYQNLPLHFSLTRKDFENICHDLFVLCLGPLHDIFQYTHINPGEIKEIVLVGGSTRIPKIQKMILEYFKPYGIEKLTCNLNPDEVVSIGASIYGYVMTHQEDPYTSNVVLLDIMPLSIGVETLQRQMSVIIPRNSTIPVKKTKYFSTDTDNEESVQIKVFEGERKLTKHNFHVGTFTLHGLPKGPRGFPVIRITFEIDINGILHISASEKKSGAQTQIDLKSWTSSKLSTEEINCLIEEAQRNEHIDVICSMKVGLIHKIISLSESILYGLKDPDLNLTKVDKRKIKTDIKNTLQWVKNREMNDLELKELEKCHQRISQLYAPLIILEKKTEKGYDVVPGNMAEVEGDDEETEYLNQYEKVVHEIDPSEYDKEEIKDLKKIIFDLGKNITSIINNPVSHLQPEDIEKITDYIGSINIWLYTNSSLSTTDYVAKIREINQFTEDILQNYHQDNIFEKDENFTIKDELHLICLTLSTSIQSNFFSLEKNDINLLQEKIENTLKWLEENPDKSYKDYADRLDEINCLCNQFYHQTQTLTLPNEREDTAESDEECEKMVELKNTMLDKIDRMINSLPNHMGEIGENMASEDIQPPREGLAIMC
jgi:heat shock protein 1/8